MAFLRSILPTCNVDGCGAVAKQALYNCRNSHMGDFCSRHAKQRLRTLKAIEAAPDYQTAKAIELKSREAKP